VSETCSTPDMAQFQERIRSTRKARNMSLQDVADASGFTKSHVWELERGSSRNPTVRAVWSLANALGVSPAWLLGLDTGGVVIAPLALEIAALIERRIARDAVQLHQPKEGGHAD
jgi:transcriptional regulator with XRE-family HTH domain